MGFNSIKQLQSTIAAKFLALGRFRPEYDIIPDWHFLLKLISQPIKA